MVMKTEATFLLLGTILLMVPLTFAQSKRIDLQGHRGARGLMPENTIPGFLKAQHLGVTTLELDVVISKDLRVVVSHEPYMSGSICFDSLGNEIPKDREKEFNIYHMTMDEIRQFDCGSKIVRRFPLQEKLNVTKPMLSEVIVATEDKAKGETGFLVGYNIEVKSSVAGDDIFHPNPDVFSDLVFAEIDKYLPWERVTIQSFDFRVLQYWHENYPEVTLAALVENNKSVETILEELRFTPDIYSPYYFTLSQAKIKKIHSKGMKVIPWTVNDMTNMKDLVEWGVDGIITDYPDSARLLGYTIPVPYK